MAQHFDVLAIVTEDTRNYYDAQRAESPAVRQHFAHIAESERRWFADAATVPDVPVQRVPDINGADCLQWARGCGADVVCLFGTAILRAGWLDAYPSRIANLHLGLSPFYRGSATLFWPFANRELQYLGTTIHLAAAKVDAGDILARIVADLRPREDYYAITNRLIRDSIGRFPQVVLDYLEGRITPQPQEPIAGRVYRKADFTEDTLASALAYVGDGLSADHVDEVRKARSCLSLQ